MLWYDYQDKWGSSERAEKRVASQQFGRNAWLASNRQTHA